MASFQQDMRKCGHCKKQTMHNRTVPNTLLHVFLTVITFGFWLIVWLLFISKGPWKCTICGKQTLFGVGI